jgi:hypothetical protein
MLQATSPINDLRTAHSAQVNLRRCQVESAGDITMIARRMELSSAVRRALGERISAALRPILTERPGVLGAYWPFRAEFDPQPLIESMVTAGRLWHCRWLSTNAARSNIAAAGPAKT